MPELATDCPHCGALKTGFVLRGETGYRAASGAYLWNTLWICNRCRDAIVVNLSRNVSDKPSLYRGDIQRVYSVTAIHPRPEPTDAPEHVPEKLSETYEEAADNLRRKSYQSAGMMFRRVLERATLEIAANEKEITFERKTPLGQRIKVLAKHQLITPAMQDWATMIQFGGNDAAHGDDDDFSQHDAERLKEFTELFLLYAFTMRERVRLARESDDNDKSVPAS